MITKLSKFKDSWVIKILLTITALSFVSLFGITGYLGNAGKNRSVIEVGPVRVTKAEISAQYNHELQTAKNIFGDNLEINDSMRTALLQGIIQKELINAIMKETANDLGVSVSDAYVRKIIFSQAEFLDADGRFSHDKFNRLLSASGWSEGKYIQTLKEDVVKQHLIHGLVENINIPKFMTPYLEKINNQQKVFKYITIDTEKLPIDRKMSNEELEQYYQDFAPQFVEPEARDISFMVLSTDDIAAQVKPSEEDIAAYYEENISQFVTPEKRNILQMVFDSEKDAAAAMVKLKAGEDFYTVAKEMAKQDKEATELGWVAQDQLIADMGEKMFSLKNGEIAGPVKSELGWHIMKLNGIKAKVEMPKAEANKKIIGEIQKERAYDEAYEITTNIEDEIGAGKSMEEIAKENKVRIYKAQGINDDGTARVMPKEFAKLLKSTDFVDSVFSYNVNEISQVIEEDDGFVLVRVDAIKDAHPKTVESVRSEIEKMWAANERSAIAQEIVNDVTHDLENGDKIDEVAGRFKLALKTTKPLKRNENFANLNGIQMKELFQEPLDSPKLYNLDNIQIIAVNSKVIDSAAKMSKEELNALRMKVASEITQDAANQLVNAYGSNYKVKVDYKEAGIEDL